MTAPPRHEPTSSRRAARALRERAARRALEASSAAPSDSTVDDDADARATADTAPIRIVRTRLRAPVAVPAATARTPRTRAEARATAPRAAPTVGSSVHLAPLHRDPPPLPTVASDDSDRRPQAQHARSGGLRIGMAGALTLAAVLVFVSASALTAATLPAAEAPSVERETVDAATTAPPPPYIPVDVESSLLGALALQPQPAAIDPLPVDPCVDTDVTTALASGDDVGAIAAAGGAESFRAAVASGRAPCVALDDPARVWVVVDKQRPFAPIDFAPSALESPVGVPNPDGGSLRPDAAAALSAMAQASLAAGAGQIGVVSAYRSYETQVDTYNGHVARRGVEGADLVSARPGFSEHQSGLAADVAPCDAGCASIDDLAASPQGGWVLAHAWEYGWIVRYEDGSTPATGYLSEPWHLRYIGPELARAYHEGGWQTLEEFFGLPPAPDYTQ